MQENGAAHILSEPSVLCMNNKEASIYVGQTQSILTQAQQSTTGQANIINNYSREDIGITLKIKPRLSNQNKVALDVETQIEDILPGSGSSADRPTTTKRKIVTTAVVNNGETIVLGGLIKNSGGKSITKVPILGDIPILGELFKSRGTADSNVNVIVYLTPYVVKNNNDMKRLKSALSELEDIQTRYNDYVSKGLKKTNKSTIMPQEQNITLSDNDNHNINIDELEIVTSADGKEKTLKLK
ncbi:Type II secretion system protein D (fragment) [Sulfurovum sp. enrichment culture clone C5]|uniref:Type II secretion system protein D n=1 Tax=Sulfurovum sp. enrichment culture clone C5 TaxID=497650 RepID=A0A0S4XQR4_9BACT